VERRAVVVGGGIAGLACGYRLRQLGIDAVVLEREPRAGGKIRTTRESGFRVEWGPQTCAFPSGLRALAAELGLVATVRPPRERARFVVRGGRLVSPLSGLSLGGLARLGRGLVRGGAPPGEDESIESYVRRRFGPEAMRRLFDPLVSGIYAGDPAKLAFASALGPAFGFARPGAPRRRRGRTVSFAGGMAALPAALAEALGKDLRIGTHVTGLRRASERSGARWAVEVAGGPAGERALEADDVVLACPADEAAALLAPHDPSLAEELRAIRYAPVTAVTLGYRADAFARPPRGFGFLAAREEGLPILGCLFCAAPPGKVALRALLGGIVGDAATIARAAVEPLLGAAAAPELVHVAHHERAIPQYEIGHARRLRAIADRLAALPGLALAGNAYRGVSVPDVIADARRIGEAIALRS
jgi:oxygen-dependent protoporphyrinogen oxidase